jgi:hypothetical protein
MAYAMKVISDKDKTKFTDNTEFNDAYATFLHSCMIVPGLFNRWPDGTGGKTSHDELVGMAYLNQEAARQIVDYLTEKDGEYNNTSFKETIPEENNQFRFIWLLPFLKSCAKYRVSLISQVLWISCLLTDFFKKKENLDGSGLTMRWLMCERMGQYWLSALAIFFWKLKMKSLGVGPKYIFENKYLVEVPVFAENALEEM